MTATQTRWFGTRSIVDPDDDFHAAMGWVDFGPCATFEQVRVRLISYVIEEGLSVIDDEVRRRYLEIARQLTQLEEPEGNGEIARAEAGGLRYTIRRQG